MSPLSQAVADYLTMRRALGYKMDKTERLLSRIKADSYNFKILTWLHFQSAQASGKSI